MQALRLGMDVMIFSDNVPVESELALKRFAQERNLMVMGPDLTAIALAALSSPCLAQGCQVAHGGSQNHPPSGSPTMSSAVIDPA